MGEASEGRGIALIVFSAACFGSIAIAVTIGQRNGLPLIAMLGWRYGAGALLLVALAGAARWAMFTREATRPILVLGVMQASMAAISLSSLQWISAATLGFLFYTYPAWIAVIAAVRRTEPITAPKVAALVLALMGIGVMVGMPGAGEIHPVGVGLALVSALIYAVYVPIIGAVDARHGGVATAAYASIGAAACFVVAGLLLPGFTGGLRMPENAAAWGVVAWLAVMSTTIGFLAFLRGLAVVGAVRAGIVSTVEPFLTALMAAALLAQPLTSATLAGGLLVAGAVLLLQWAQRARAAPSTQP